MSFDDKLQEIQAALAMLLKERGMAGGASAGSGVSTQESNEEKKTGRKTDEVAGNWDPPMDGYCHLLLFDISHWPAAKSTLGADPDVASLRRFANAVRDPFSTRSVTVTVGRTRRGVRAHVVADIGDDALRPSEALAALDKTLRVGAASVADVSCVDADMDTDGYCFLRLFDESCHDKAKRLGSMPSVLALRCFYNANPGSRYHGKVVVSVKRGTSYGVAHVQRHAGGNSVEDFFASSVLRDADCVGSNITAPQEQGKDFVPVIHTRTMDVASSGPSMDIDLPVAFFVNHEAGALWFRPRENFRIKRVTQYFESVELVSASFTCVVTGDSQSVLRGIVTPQTTVPQNNFDWIGAQYSLFATGNAMGSTTTVFQLPEGHIYNKQIKGLALSNGDPNFAFYYTSMTPGYAVCRGNLRLRLRGVGAPVAINIGSKAAAATGFVGAPSRIRWAADDEESSDEEAPSGSRTQPARPNTTPPRRAAA